MERRGFLGALLAGAMAPAIVQAGSLMRIAPPRLVLWGDGVHDDAPALQAMLDANYYNGERFELRSGTYLISRTLDVRGSGVVFEGAELVVPRDWCGPAAGPIMHIHSSVDGVYVNADITDRRSKARLMFGNAPEIPSGATLHRTAHGTNWVNAAGAGGRHV